MNAKATYNERAWAIDVISEIRRIASLSSQVIVSAGGEWGVSSNQGAKTLFPDVLLYGEPNHGMLLQGWELKMPDTPVTDGEFLENAKEKARRLSLDSFLVWNAKDAVLYHAQEGEWIPIRHWSTGLIRTREDVLSNEHEWKRMLEKIIKDLNSYFSWHKTDITPKYAIGQITAVTETFIEDGAPTVATVISKLLLKSATFRSKVRFWWKTRDCEIGDTPDVNILAREVLIHEFNRVLLVNFLRPVCKEVTSIDKLTNKSPKNELEEIFQRVSHVCDHFQVLEPHFASTAVPVSLCTALNSFLREVNLSSLDQDFLQTSLQGVIDLQRRKARGIYCTPQLLAKLLVELTLNDLEDPVIDPCCGTGTFPRAVIETKCDAGMKAENAIETTWASDISQTALQFSALSLVRTYDRATLRLFKSDVLNLVPGQRVTLVDAYSGAPFEARIPRIRCAVFNPPFIRAEAYRDILPKKYIFPENLPERADYSALVILHVLDIMEPGGTIGVVLPNSWLATDWGVQFRERLHKEAIIRCIVASSNGKWFGNADIVATLLVAEKRSRPLGQGDSGSEERTIFATTKEPITEWASNRVMDMAHLIREGSSDEHIDCNSVSWTDISSFEQGGLGWQTFFADTSWLKNLWGVLKPITTFFDVARGSRRGWDKLFFPGNDCGIERQYIMPVLKSPTSISRLVADADSTAFCCGKSESELERLKHSGALSWIRRFAATSNGTGRPLPEVLAKQGCFWYEMSASELADLAMPLNPGKRLFVAKLNHRSFVNQRLTRLSVKPSWEGDISLLHALMNSVICLFFQEALGFPRGLGALDLSSTRIAAGMKIPDPTAISKETEKLILSAFRPLCERNILNFDAEMATADRLAFEHVVAKAYGYEPSLSAMINSAIRLFKIRNSVSKSAPNSKTSSPR